VAPHDIPPDLPTTIGRYRILERLSPARDGRVYKGFDPIIERHVAVKVFSFGALDAAAAGAIRQTFYGQMQRIGALTHTGITTLFDAGEAPGGAFMATEFVEGTSLSELLAADRDWSLPEQVSLVAQLADALEYAREQSVPHLHLRPSNVLLDADGTVKVRGFGIASIQDALESETTQNTARSEWSAPERRAGSPGDGRSDVYSLARIAQRILGDAVPEPPASAAALAEVFQQALAPDANDRFATAGAFKYALMLALGLDEVEVRIAWETTREAGNVMAADRSGTGFPHSAVNGDLTAMILETPTHRSPLSSGDVETIAETVSGADDPELTKPA